MMGFALGLSLICFGNEPTNEEHLLDVVRTAYRANRAALSFGTVRFQRFVDKQARDEAAAFKGDFARDICADGLLIYNEQKVRYECVFPTEVIASQRTQVGKDQWRSSLDPSIRIVTDGKLTLFDTIYVDDTGQKETHTAQIFPANSRFFDGIMVPLNLGNPQPRAHALDTYIDDVISGREGWKLLEIKSGDALDGREVVHLTIKLPRSEIQYWIDLDRGGVPLQSLQTIESGTTRTTTRIVNDDLRQVAGKAWLPFRQTMFISPRLAKQFVIQDADFEKPPAQALFHLDFPEPRPMINSASGVRYEPRKTWGLDSLPSPVAAGTKPVILAEPASAPVLPGPRRPASWTGAVALAVGVPLLVLGCYLIVRARRSRSQ